MIMLKWIRIALGFLLGMFVLLHLINLDRIPLVWFDEVMGLDPAVNAVFKDGYRSWIWPQQGTEGRFMAYLPIRFLFHMVHLKLLPFTVFWQRLPWAAYFFASAVFLYKAVRSGEGNALLALLFVLLFSMDRTVFEVARSMRVDPISLLFLAALGWSYFARRNGLQAALASLLIFIHPNLWFGALVLFLNACGRSNRSSDRPVWAPHVYWLIPTVLMLGYLLSIRFDVEGFYAQLMEHGSDHSAGGGLTDRLKDHFVGRFWPYYLSQPYIPLMIYVALILALYRIFRRQANGMDWALVLTHVYWMLALAPFYRYNAVLMLLSLLSLIPLAVRIKQAAYVGWPAILLLLIHPINAFARHGLALAQRDQRDPKPVVQWLRDQLPSGTCLLSGSDVAYYAVASEAQHAYVMYNLQPLKLDPFEYEHCYLLLSGIEDTAQLALPEPISTYRTTSPLYQRSQRYFNGPTYSNMGLYALDPESFLRITAEMDRRNRERLNAGR